MKTQKANFVKPQSAFTLIELLVVIAVIGVLAAIIFPAFAAIKKAAIVKRIQGEMKFVETAIEAYKENLDVYPTENRMFPHLNPLYYELTGSTKAGNVYQPLSGIGNISVSEVSPSPFFGVGNDVSGFINITRGSDDELKTAKNLLTGLRPAQYLEVVSGGVPGVVLGTREKGPTPLMLSDAAAQNSINPWRYQSSSATNNQGRYDLWVDVLISGKTNRFSNWRDKPFDPNP
jgi:prepilin-type N-terminal cleavage/methylation domain-containing protein